MKLTLDQCLIFSHQIFVWKLREMEGKSAPTGWGGVGKLGDNDDMVTVEVNNVLAEKLIVNVFGVIKGFVDPGMIDLRPCGKKHESLVLCSS